MNRLKPVRSSSYYYDNIIGTGGIGSGIFFLLEQDHTLGRNESRLGKLLPYKDYCKQHIILHYISVLLKAGTPQGINVFPIGKVGNDEAGKLLVDQMRSVGMELSNVQLINDSRTLFSVCFQYPDKSGGNITTSNGASALVKPNDVDAFFEKGRKNAAGERSIFLAAPEVSVETRIRLLEHGRKAAGLNIASVLSGEVDHFRRKGGFALTDILSINIDEAAAIALMPGENCSKEDVIDNCISNLRRDNPGISVLITDGANGVYSFSHGKLTYRPGYKVEVLSTAGAGDAFLAGTICGLCCGLEIHPEDLQQPGAVDLGILLAAFSVTTADTINMNANAASLKEFAHTVDAEKKLLQIFY